MDTPKVATIVKNAEISIGDEFLKELEDEQFEMLKKLAFDFGFKKITFVYHNLLCQKYAARQEIYKNQEKAKRKHQLVKDVKISLVFDLYDIEREESEKDEYGVLQYTGTKIDEKVQSHFGDTPTE